jgi:glyoxylase-like metal-dependent hydrolase (beta-lactamase superfamily II)
VSGAMYNHEHCRHLLEPLRAAGKLELVSGDVDLTEDLALMYTPGETRGHQVVRLQSGGKRLYYLGDLVHFPIQIEKPRWAVSPRSDETYDDFERSRARVWDDAASDPSVIVFTHGTFPAWGRVERSALGSWNWRYI